MKWVLVPALVAPISLALLSGGPALAGFAEEMASAQASGRVVYVAVADGAGGGLEAARSVARRAQGLTAGSVVLDLDRRDPAEAPWVARYALEAAPGPLVLLVARGGVVAQEGAAEGAAERLAALVPARTAAASVAAANADGRAVFLVVTDGPGPALEEARSVARRAQAAAPRTAVVELDRRDPAEAESVARFRVVAAPVPLVLVVGANGVPAGGARPAPAAAERLAALVPTPGKAAYFKHLSEQRVALVAASRAGMPEREPLIHAASSAVSALAGRAALVLLDLDDPEEARFLAEMRIDRALTRPRTLVVNPKGQVLGRFDGLPTAEQLVQAARATHTCSDPACRDCGKR